MLGVSLTRLCVGAYARNCLVTRWQTKTAPEGLDIAYQTLGKIIITTKQRKRERETEKERGCFLPPRWSKM